MRVRDTASKSNGQGKKYKVNRAAFYAEVSYGLREQKVEEETGAYIKA